ncbi:MAG: hypothetical protein IJE89_01245 [Bacilli bacterium]|nr:hypothetical protein [Bacilli bacterium]
MENFIVKFKKDLKGFQSSRKKVIKECERELSILNKILNNDISVLEHADVINVGNSLFMSATIAKIKLPIATLVDKKARKKDKQKAKEDLKETYDSLLSFTEYLKTEYYTTQNIINAFENDKIKDPINSINVLFNQISLTTITLEEADKILGMAIAFNSRYAKRNKNHQIENIDAIHELARDYYNEDGSFKYVEDLLTYERKINELIKNQLDIMVFIHKILSFNQMYTAEDLINLRFEYNKRFRHQQPLEIFSTTEMPLEENYSIPEKVRKALQELKKYYKNGSIITIPNDLEKFYKLLEETNLDEQEKKYIINLINIEISKNRNKIIDKYLSTEEKDAYNNAIKLLNKFTYSNADSYALKQYIEELQTILEFLETEQEEENKEYLLNEIATIIEQLIIICNRYKIDNGKSSNRLIFLTSKNGIPFIEEDIKSLDSTYEKAIISLINKISPENQSHFRKILNNEPLPYHMHEVISPRAHVAFIEIETGIYIVIGANIPRNGYKELINRLLVNTKEIERIENLIKNPDMKNQLLRDNEQYLKLSEEQKTTLTKKKTNEQNT